MRKSIAIRVILLGAGASAAMLGVNRAPVSAQFGKTLNDLDSQWCERYPFLGAAVDYLQMQSDIGGEWRLDEVWNGIDENFKLTGIIRNKDFSWPKKIPEGKKLYTEYNDGTWDSFWVLAGWELKRALAEIYGTRLKSLLIEPKIADKWLSQKISRLNQEDVVVSMNYELLAESVVRQLWNDAGNCRTDEEFRSQGPRKGPLILKPHGSLDWLFKTDWKRNRSRVDRTEGGTPITDQEIDLDPNFWETRPLVVAPVRYKDEIVFRQAQPRELVEVLNFQWKRFIEAVSCANELHVLGYRFPSEDSYGNRMLQEAMRLRTSGAQLRVRLYLTPETECENVKKRLEQDILRAKSVQVECCGPIPQDDVR